MISTTTKNSLFTYRLHRIMTKSYNAVFSRLPHGIKYTGSQLLWKAKWPYAVLNEGDSVLVVGCARDIVLAGRSRSIKTSLSVGSTGRVVILEPDEANHQRIVQYANENGLTNITALKVGAWNEKTELTFFSNPAHPAANRIDDVTPNDVDVEAESINVVTIPVDRINNILQEHGIEDNFKLVSLTINGAEFAALQGMEDILERFEYISVARAAKKSDVLEFLAKHGFVRQVPDDRGITFARTSTIVS